MTRTWHDLSPEERKEFCDVVCGQISAFGPCDTTLKMIFNRAVLVIAARTPTVETAQHNYHD
jgi:hypothetical protein